MGAMPPRLPAALPRLALPRLALPRLTLPLLAVPLLALCFARPVLAQGAEDWPRCTRAIAAAEPASGIPPGLLGAIALVESGQRNPATGAPTPWPWSYNVNGESHSPPSKAAAVAEVAALQARGIRSIDVGCMQVNLLHHPTAFATLDEAFDPPANLRYAIRFLKELQGRTGDWGAAIARYHSGEAERGAAYQRRVTLARMGAAWNSGGGVPLPGNLARDICAPGLTPTLLIGGRAEARRFLTPEARRAGRPPPLVRTAAARPRIACLRPAGRR
ncbi:lytic transglycosylase domain-containing protein [Roseomonas sp. USHLN139]|uniref:lytic transglycosylase domain-containing protein n=1 Tax=Roseomonas sp. USHLN139 TaxID=3081298 RepID=UPI003B02E104